MVLAPARLVEVLVPHDMQEVQFLDIVIGIEQGAALGGAGLVVEAERGALILHVDGSGAQQVDQSALAGDIALRFLFPDDSAGRARMRISEPTRRRSTIFRSRKSPKVCSSIARV